MAKSNVRIKIPKNPEKLLKLADRINKKHIADAGASPLGHLEDFNWTDNGPKILTAQTLNDTAKKMERDIELMYEERDLLINTIDKTVKSSRDILLGIHRLNPKKLGDWGFEVDDSPRAKKPAATEK